MTGTHAEVPLLDVHRTTVEAGVAEVWAALLEVLAGSLGAGASGRVAALLRCEDRVASGPRPLAAGSAVPGFHVTEAIAGERLVLAGRHRFSAYELVFEFEPAQAGRTKLSAQSWARFPGVAGWLYRTMLMRTGGHVLAVRRLLGAVRRRAEAEVEGQASSR